MTPRRRVARPGVPMATNTRGMSTIDLGVILVLFAAIGIGLAWALSEGDPAWP